MIAVFDSGLGGLMALQTLHALLPQEDLYYYADTANAPYGTKSERQLLFCAKEVLFHLLERQPRAVLAACGTVSATILPHLQKICPVPLYGALDDAVSQAVFHSQNRRIGVIATDATIRCGTVERALLSHCPAARVFCVACPSLVCAVEDGVWAKEEQALPLCRAALAPLAQSGIDTLLLGCTHFVWLKRYIAQILPDVRLVDAGETAAWAMIQSLPHTYPQACTETGSVEYAVSGCADAFAQRARALGFGKQPAWDKEYL